MRRSTPASLALVALVAFPALAAAGAAPNASTFATGGPRGSVLAIPAIALGGLFATFSMPFVSERVLVDGRRLEREEGWAPLGFQVEGKASALRLEVTGRVQFDRAEIVFEDGTLEPVDLHGAVRANGLFELARYAGSRDVMLVRVRARAASSRAQVALRTER